MNDCHTMSASIQGGKICGDGPSSILLAPFPLLPFPAGSCTLLERLFRQLAIDVIALMPVLHLQGPAAFQFLLVWDRETNTPFMEQKVESSTWTIVEVSLPHPPALTALPYLAQVCGEACWPSGLSIGDDANKSLVTRCRNLGMMQREYWLVRIRLTDKLWESMVYATWSASCQRVQDSRLGGRDAGFRNGAVVKTNRFGG